MVFQPGHKLARGKPVGTKNKRTYEAMAVIEKSGFEPLKAMITTYHLAMERYHDYAKRFGDNRISPMEDNSGSFLKIAAQMSKEIASFAYPKLRSIEQNVNIGVEVDLAKKIEERKEALRKMLEDKPSEIEVASVVDGKSSG